MATKTASGQNKELAALRDTALDITAQRNLSTLLSAIVEQAVRLLDADGGCLYLCDSAPQSVRCVVSYETPRDDAGTMLAYGEGVAGRVAATGLPLITGTDRADDEPLAAGQRAEPPMVMISVPLVWQGQVTGVIQVLGDAETRLFTQAEQDLLASFANHAATAVENARLYERAQQEIAERRRAEEEITELLRKIERAKQEWESTADSLPDLICLIDDQGRVIRANRTVESWNLSRVSEVSGREFHQLLHPHCGRDRCYLSAFWGRAWRRASQGESDQCDAYDEMLGRHVLVRVQPYEAEGERAAAGCTVVTVRDITERKRAEMDNVRLFQEAERLRAFNESIVQGVAEAILMEDAAGMLTFANSAAEELLGYQREDLLGLHWSAIVPEDQQATVHRAMVKRAQGVESRYETAVLGKAGDAIPVICSARPLFEDGQFVGVLSAFTDMRDYKRIEEYMRGQDRLAAVGQLAAGIAHDFNNILTSIVGFAQLACMRDDIPESAKADLQPIVSAGHRAAHLIRQILDFSRTSLTQQQPIALSEFLDEMVRFLQRTIPENVEMTVDRGADHYLVEADPVQLHQALTNLALNARDAMPDGGELRFQLAHVSLEDDDAKPFPNMHSGKWVALSVSDTGTGIPEDVLPRIYEPFFTTKEVGEGTGLGLSQVYGIVKQHDGFIDARTEMGGGTTFTIYLPALDLPMATVEEARTLQEEPAHGQGETVLLVEDEMWVLMATKAILEHLGYRVLAASSSQEALDLHQEHRDQIDMVLADMVMPGMNGQELFHALRDRDPDIRVALMTGYPLEGQGKKLLMQGIVTWAQKPLDANRLAQVVAKGLKG